MGPAFPHRPDRPIGNSKPCPFQMSSAALNELRPLRFCHDKQTFTIEQLAAKVRGVWMVQMYAEFLSFVPDEHHRLVRRGSLASAWAGARFRSSPNNGHPPSRAAPAWSSFRVVGNGLAGRSARGYRSGRSRLTWTASAGYMQKCVCVGSGRTRMMVFPPRRSAEFKAATASRVDTLPMFDRSRPSRTCWTISQPREVPRRRIAIVRSS
jgi:hypothetical protein